ncbi:MAG TPA: hypothetical protein VFB14_16940 [Bryobacteraceae bacterium]|jgi:hypothetical protein|nr:hypothetical protein [Bryobacteraceae bacterium]
MQFSVIGGDAEFGRLYAAYQDAWKQLGLQVDYWQSLCSDTLAERSTIEQAEMAAWKAEACYRQARNALAEYILKHKLARQPEESGRGTLVAEAC